MNFTTLCYLIFNFLLCLEDFFYPRHLPTTHDPRHLATFVSFAPKFPPVIGAASQTFNEKNSFSRKVFIVIKMKNIPKIGVEYFRLLYCR